MFIVPISQMPAIAPIEKSAVQAARPEANTGMPFKQIFEEAVDNLRETQAQSNEDAYRLAMGQADDLHNIMINSEKAATALELTVQLTSRAVAAYNEIMRMQI
ncbi:flagellar hook-basal body complex protein FliE [Hydrogenoanaerobacterium sp.]|uniref:flagellar hook-basal body complex protein FliE n=1 Tax=Hydrogenoanaerobacterium sp. TaxID=2953763 RepID=UPI0028A2D1A2|nr:flagellar hook-basal body complex protein FliE [Hydrogenoanaerobacterium sp.]